MTAAIALSIAVASALSSGCGGSGRAALKAQNRGAGASGASSQASQFTPAPAAVSRAASLPLPRQVAQLFLVSLNGTAPGAVAGLGSLDWGGVVFDSSNFVDDAQISGLAAQVLSSARRAGHLAPLVAATQEGGPQTAFRDLPPQSEPVIGAGGQAALARSQALLAGKRLRALGFNMTLAPLADVDTPGGPLSGRLFSADPGAVAQFSLAAVNGYAAAGVISAVGHFPGTGGASADPDQMTASVGGSLADLRSRDLIPFAAVARKAPVILMSNAAYTAFDGVTPAGLLASATRLLRRDYSYQGVVMSDDLDAALQPTGEAPGPVALQALEAGDDLLYISGPPSEHQAAYAAVLAAAQASSAVRGRVYAALLRVLTLKVRYGILR